MKEFWRFVWMIFAVCTAMVGRAIHHSVFWSICDLIFYPLAWVKWLLCQEVSLPIIKHAFAFFLFPGAS